MSAAVTTSRSTRGQILRFIAVGAVNTLGSYAIFLILANWLDEIAAFSIGFACGLAFTTFASSTWVFRANAGRTRLAVFVGWYLMIWLIGVGIVHAIGRGDVEQHLVASAVSIAVTVPLNFIGGRRILAAPSKSARGPIP